MISSKTFWYHFPKHNDLLWWWWCKQRNTSSLPPYFWKFWCRCKYEWIDTNLAKFCRRRICRNNKGKTMDKLTANVTCSGIFRNKMVTAVLFRLLEGLIRDFIDILVCVVVIVYFVIRIRLSFRNMYLLCQ